MSKLTTFSIILPNTNSPLVGKIIAALKAQTIDLASGELFVVGPGVPSEISTDENVRFIHSGPGTSYASDKRNLGMQSARGEIFLFLDDDCLPAPDWIERHLARHQLGEQVVGGAVQFGRRNYFQLADNVSAFHDLLPYTQPGPRPYLATANLSVHRSVVARAGEMIPGHNRAEDLEWTLRFRNFGYRLFFEPLALVCHDPPRRTFMGVWQHWIGDAPETLRVRLQNADLLQTPKLAKTRNAYLWCAPLVAAWATARTFQPLRTFFSYGYTLPLVYLTKLAWCWSAYISFPTSQVSSRR